MKHVNPLLEWWPPPSLRVICLLLATSTAVFPRHPSWLHLNHVLPLLPDPPLAPWAAWVEEGLGHVGVGWNLPDSDLPSCFPPERSPFRPVACYSSLYPRTWQHSWRIMRRQIPWMNGSYLEQRTNCYLFKAQPFFPPAPKLFFQWEG